MENPTDNDNQEENSSREQSKTEPKLEELPPLPTLLGTQTAFATDTSFNVENVDAIMTKYKSDQQESGEKQSHWASAQNESDLSKYDNQEEIATSTSTSIDDTDNSQEGASYPNQKEKVEKLPEREIEFVSALDFEDDEKQDFEAVNGILVGDENDEDEDDAIMEADNPLMQRVQNALFKQLSQQDTKLSIVIKEKEEAVRKTLKKREEVGVELYSTQQQLARMQALLEGAQDNIAIIKNYREEAERVLKHTTTQYREEMQKRQTHAQNLEQHKQELEKISITLKQVDLYNDELRSKILIAKRTTLKAEEDIIKQEAEKKRQAQLQDFFIDHLSDRLRRLQERRALYETQILAQQKETKAALDTLHFASTEMEAIQFEKRQLLHQWKSSLIGLQRRDEILLNVEKEIQKNKDTMISLNGEIAGFKLSLRRAQEQSETLTMLLSKLENETEHLKRIIANVADQKDKLMDTHMLYSKTLTKTEEELEQANQERQAVQLEIAAVLKLTRQTAVTVKNLENEIADNLQNQFAIEKGATGTMKDSSRLRNLVHEKESTIATAMNELGNVKLETLNVIERVRRMKEDMGSLEKELAMKNDLIEKYELEIRRRNDELGKKQGEMDALNKKYDLLTSRSQEESMGPLEATIHNVGKLVEAKEKDCLQLQQFWMRAQNELVATSKKSHSLQEEMSDLKMRLAVLCRKKAVVNNQFELEEKEIREHQRNIRGLQNDMVKINTLLSKQSQVQSVLEENNIGLEQEFRARLKIAELDSVRIEAKIDELRDEKKRALQGLVEAERQLMLWEKKIQLAKETQAALDPNIGATEIREMSIEIHRMRLRYASMLKLQEHMISEMEKSVYRRESIAMRTKTKGKGSSQAMLQKDISDLSKKIRLTISDVEESEHDLKTLVDAQDQVAQQIKYSQKSYEDLENRETDCLKNLEHALAIGETLLHQRQARRYSELLQGKYVFLVKDSDSREDEFEQHKNRLDRISEVLASIKEEYPHLKDIVDPLHKFLENTSVIL
ncbi:Coiled-coil domain-containing protein 40 [Physocladia obscura]|uniref:Coiled-coil domain-containing protein 40 n=1 Tax=Physocladia obscura TaxID=109957 RepID=A0AAD5XKU8_9FUNG|nr:Coiled-coil domain-containing protein 40 [Physocladia obscura]